MLIGPFDTDRDVLVVAEIGNNHEGSYALAEEMIGLAAKAGAGAVKFQTFRTEHYVSRRDEARFRRLKKFELSFAEFERLSAAARKAGLIFLSTPFDLESAEFLNTIVPAFKIASGDNTFHPLLERVAGFGKSILLSSGLADLGRLRQAKTVIENVWRRTGATPELAVLHCVASYPVPPEEANLAAITRLREEFGGTVGYSDHTIGIEAAVMAVALGARIIEKHFTIDKQHSDFRDHQLSADPRDMAALVRRVREAAVMLGSGEKEPQKCERANEGPMRRSIAVRRDMPEGAVLAWEDLTWIRPGGGFAPGDERLVVGRTLRRAVQAGDILTTDMLSEPRQPVLDGASACVAQMATPFVASAPRGRRERESTLTRDPRRPRGGDATH
jgi:sialic acid synthase SpsE